MPLPGFEPEPAAGRASSCLPCFRTMTQNLGQISTELPAQRQLCRLTTQWAEISGADFTAVS